MDANNLITINSLDLLDVIIPCIAIVVTVVISNRDMKRKIRLESEKKLEKKADKPYVDQQDRALHHRINKIEKDNDSLGEKIDKNHNFMIERIETLNNNVLEVLKNR